MVLQTIALPAELPRRDLHFTLRGPADGHDRTMECATNGTHNDREHSSVWLRDPLVPDAAEWLAGASTVRGGRRGRTDEPGQARRGRVGSGLRAHSPVARARTHRGDWQLRRRRGRNP